MAELIRDSAARQLSLTLPTITRLDLTDAERNELVRVLRRIVDNDQFQLSPRIRRLRQILDKLAPPAPATGLFPGPKVQRHATTAPMSVCARGQRFKTWRMWP